MNAETFCYWLQGALELGHTDHFDANDIQIIQDHLNLVFNKVTPDRQPRLSDIARKFDTPIKPFDLPPTQYLQQPLVTC